MSCGHYHGAFSHFRGPNRKKKPLPKCRIDLGLLFEGCIRQSTLWELVQAKQIKFPEEEVSLLLNGEPGDTALNGDTDLKSSNLKSVSVNDVITHMTVLSPRSKDEINLKLKNCLNVLRDDLEAIERVAKEITEDASRNGLKYFEVGVDPTKFISEGEAGGSSPSSTEILRAVLRGLKAGWEETKTKGSVLVQVERGRTGEAEGVLTLCESLRTEGVVGLELTCNETVINTQIAGDAGSVESLLFSAEDIAFMAAAKEKKIRRSVQAGEFGPPEMVFQALEKLQADRIVFGYNVTEDISLYQDCKTNKIHFVTMASLSLVTGSVPLSRYHHPIVQLSEDNMEWSISAGLPVITGCWTVQEVELLQSWGLTETDIAQATFSAARASFCNDQDKKELMKELRKVFGIEDKVELEIFINHKCGQPDDPRKVLKTSF